MKCPSLFSGKNKTTLNHFLLKFFPSMLSHNTCTNILQDDPPHPDMYTDESVLKTELSLPVASDSELTDQSLPGAEFVGSTINLQDLVG